ncbi:unnamed protein product [Boreogadus saida]
MRLSFTCAGKQLAQLAAAAAAAGQRVSLDTRAHIERCDLAIVWSGARAGHQDRVYVCVGSETAVTRMRCSVVECVRDGKRRVDVCLKLVADRVCALAESCN